MVCLYEIITKSKELYTSEKELSIDESMIKYKGNSFMVVFGFRAFMLCENETLKL